MSLSLVFVLSFFIISIFGTLLHFTHQLFKNGIILHIFSAINESTWEHMKLLVAPTIIVLFFQYVFLHNTYPYLFFGILSLYIVELISIPLLYGIALKITKEVPFIITILIFYIAILLGIFTENIVMINKISIVNEYVSLFLFILITSLFAIFTYFPPKHSIFRDPVTKKFGDTQKY